MPPRMPKESSGGIIFHRSSCSELSTVLNDHEAPAEDQQLKETDREEIVESDQERNRKETRTETNGRKNPVRPRQKDAESGEDNGQMKFRSLLEDEGRNKEDKNNQEEKVLFSERSIQVKDGHIVVGHVKWKECSSRSMKVCSTEIYSFLDLTSVRSLSFSSRLCRRTVKARLGREN